MDKNEEINYWISQLKMLEDELLVQETMNDRAIVRKDIYNTRLKINELVRELTGQFMFNFIIGFMCIKNNLLEISQGWSMYSYSIIF